jgi:hypothetical protein
MHVVSSKRPQIPTPIIDVQRLQSVNGGPYLAERELEAGAFNLIGVGRCAAAPAGGSNAVIIHENHSARAAPVRPRFATIQ